MNREWFFSMMVAVGPFHIKPVKINRLQVSVQYDFFNYDIVF